MKTSPPLLLLPLLAIGCGSPVHEVAIKRPADLPFKVSWQETNYLLRCVHFADARTGWAVGNGRILHTKDAGATWEMQAAGTEADLTSVYFVDTRMGWAVGSGGTIVHTRDAGATWETQVVGQVAGYRTLGAVVFSDKDHGWAVGWSGGSNGLILHTANGGQTWTQQASRTQDTLNSVHFADARRGWAVGGRGTILHTDDAGATWKPQPSGSDESLNSVSFVDARTGWAISDNGTVLHTDDAGVTWETRPSGIKNQFQSVRFVDAHKGWIAGHDGLVLHTEDGGRSWVKQPTKTQVDLFSVRFIDARTGWAVGEGRTILHTEDGGATWETQEGGVSTTFDVVQFVDARNGWAAGSNSIIHTADGGRTWEDLAQPELFSATAMHFVDARTGWIVGLTGRIFHTANAGQTWELQASGVDAHFQSVFFVSPQIGWVVGTGKKGFILHTRNAGATWAEQPHASKMTLHAVHFVDERTGWVGGGDGTILHTNDGGEHWAAQQSRTHVSLSGVHFADTRTGWAFGQRGTILHTNDGGEHWAAQQSGTNEHLASVQFLDARRGWVVGADGTILATADAGENWSAQPSGTRSSLTSLSFADDRSAWITGSTTNMLKGTRNDDAPYASRFRVADGSRALTLDWDVQDEHPEGVKSTAVAYRSFENAVWQPVATDGLERRGNRFELRWDPAGKVPEGAEVAFRLSLSDEAGNLYQQEIPGAFAYRPWWSRQPEWVKGGLVALGALGAYYALCSAVLWASPLTLLKVHRHLPAAELAESAAPNEPWKLLIRAALVLTGLPAMAKSGRVRRAWLERYRAGKCGLDDLEPSIRAAYIEEEDCLDAWIGRHAVAAREAFERIDAVARRRIHIPLPVRVGSPTEGQRLAEPEPEDFRGSFRQDRVVLAIVGTGGGGKSSLAFQLARWALDDDPDRRPAGHRMIPVLIEEETTDLVEAVGRNLRRMIDEEEGEADLVLSLLRRRRLLVIVDALSERSEATRRHVETIHGRAPVHALLVTTRREPDFGPIAATALWPERIDVNSLVWFLTEYLRRTGAEALFPGRAALQLSDRLLALVERGGRRLVVTPLLIRLFVDNATELRRRGRPIEDLPLSVAETILEYLRRVNPKSPGTPNAVPDDALIQAARLLAAHELAPNYVPQDFDHQGACRALDDAGIKPGGEHVVARLIANGILESRDVGGTPFLRFALDPVAEYLAALYWLDRLRGSRADWEDWLAKVRAVDGYPESIRGFLVALEDSTTAYGPAFRIPEALTFPWEDLERSSAPKPPLKVEA